MYNDKFLSILSQNFLEILEDNEYYDITFKVGNDPYVKVFHAHIVILNYRSPYLRKFYQLTLIKIKMMEALPRIKLSNIRQENFQTILRYISIEGDFL
ncbi:hypothetical protein RhiirB3_447605 [Rhizophagus irregularis]|nr:hypothetical protein RhiirB3_447605 [Rhizophagus irregularis]